MSSVIAASLHHDARSQGAPPAAAPWRCFSSAAPASSGEPVWRVSDLIDANCGPYASAEQQASPLQVLEPGLRSYGGKALFCGQVSTIKCINSNVLVHQAVKESGKGRVLVVDAGASLQSATLGDILAAIAAKHGWEGLVINGCIRDAHTLPSVPIGIKALGTNPMKPGKGEPGQRDVTVVVGGVAIAPGDWLYSDEDGILISPTQLELPDAEQMLQVQRAVYGLDN